MSSVIKLKLAQTCEFKVVFYGTSIEGYMYSDDMGSLSNTHNHEEC